MNKPAKTALKIVGIVGAIVLLLFGLCFFSLNFMVDDWVKSSNETEAAARKYMDSLTQKDIQIWSERTKYYLDKFHLKTSDIYTKDVPAELSQLGISAIHIDTNWVGYIWLGGMDCTRLEVEKISDGHFQFMAVYNDESNRVIWPKTTNLIGSQTPSRPFPQ